MGWVTACLLHNESASYYQRPAKASQTPRRSESESEMGAQVAGNRPEAEVI